MHLHSQVNTFTLTKTILHLSTPHPKQSPLPRQHHNPRAIAASPPRIRAAPKPAPNPRNRSAPAFPIATKPAALAAKILTHRGSAAGAQGRPRRGCSSGALVGAKVDRAEHVGQQCPLGRGAHSSQPHCPARARPRGPSARISARAARRRPPLYTCRRGWAADNRAQVVRIEMASLSHCCWARSLRWSR